MKGGIIVCVVSKYVTELVQPKGWLSLAGPTNPRPEECLVTQRENSADLVYTHSTLALRSCAQYTDHLFMIMGRPIDQVVKCEKLSSHD